MFAFLFGPNEKPPGTVDVAAAAGAGAAENEFDPNTGTEAFVVVAEPNRFVAVGGSVFAPNENAGGGGVAAAAVVVAALNTFTGVAVVFGALVAPNKVVLLVFPAPN